MSAFTSEKLELMVDAFSEIIQVNVSMWRIVYMLAEVVSLIVVFIILPVWVIKLIRWAINEIFSKK